MNKKEQIQFERMSRLLEAERVPSKPGKAIGLRCTNLSIFR